MKKSMLPAVFIFAIVLVNAQEKITKKTIKSSTKNPNVTITVKKGYDKNGNLVSVDSAYSYVYSNIKNDSISEKDLYSKFKSDWNQQFYSFDSLFKLNDLMESPFKMNDFYTNDFFKNYFLENEQFKATLKKMDSLKNNFYKLYNKEFEDATKKKTFQ